MVRFVDGQHRVRREVGPPRDEIPQCELVERGLHYFLNRSMLFANSSNVSPTSMRSM